MYAKYLATALVLFAASLATEASAVPFNIGHVFASVSNGRVQHYDAAGNLLETLDTTMGGFTTGCAFDSSGRLYVTDFSVTNVTRFDGPGDPHPPITFGSGYGPGVPESILFDGTGNVYVGHAAGGGIHKLDSAGNPITTFAVTPASDWIDLASDQCTMFYGFEGSTVERFDVCTNTPLTTFATGLSQAFAMRLLPGGGLLVADRTEVKRFDAGGNLIQTYDAAGEDSWFALNLDPNGTSFWSGNFDTGNFYKINIASGLVELGPINTGTGSQTLFGLCVFGEITVSVENCTNGVDDDGDTLVDCQDPDCALDPACLPECGNGVIDPGEQCDPPGSITCPPGSPGGAFLACSPGCVCPVASTTTTTTSTTAPTSSTNVSTTVTIVTSTTTTTGCAATGPENTTAECSDMMDNNCNGLIDCADPSCSQVFPCIEAPNDPATIKFGRGGNLDVIRAHARLPIATVDLAATPVGVLLSNANGAIYSQDLPAGALVGDTGGKKFRYRNPGARTSGGLFSVKVRRNIDGASYTFGFVAYGNLSAATDPNMRLQFYLGTDANAAADGRIFITRDALWTRTANGWRAPKDH